MPAHPRPARNDYDVVICGARCAGAATAMLLARAGLRVLAVDRSPEGSDTLSTHALMRGGVLQLSRWGLLPALEAEGTPAIRTTTFHYEDETLALPIKPRDGVDALRAPRRTVLDPLLVRAAREAGAEVLHGVPVVDLLRDPHGRARGVALASRGDRVSAVQAGVVVGADGMRSKVAALAGAGLEHVGRHRSATLYRYVPVAGLDGYHWHYRPGVAAGAIPTNGGLAAVFVALPRARWERERARGLAGMFERALLEAAPDLAGRVAEAPSAGPIHAFEGAPGFLRRAHGPGWALVGDAGAFRDPITSHGITDALRDAEWLAEAATRGGEAEFREYQEARDDVALPLMRLSDEIASFPSDMDHLRALHLELSRAMARELEVMRARGSGPGEAGGPLPLVSSAPSAAAS